MADEIDRNFVFLAKHITNLTEILTYLRQTNVISENEAEEIQIKGETTMEKNVKLLNMIKRKNLSLSTFADILKKTNNRHCVKAIEGNQNLQELELLQPKILNKKWWQDIKILIKCLQKRKIGDKLLIEELHDRILRDENRMVVICESADAAKLTGLGGVGKTLTATWYAHHYEDEYDHVIWIDAGEDSLLTSFKKLARDLDVKHLDKLLDLEDYLIKSYEALEEFKCLWIFDNAENCRGDNGIQKILPVKKINFYCLITSRLRDWGIPNVGYEQISRFELNIFWEMESLDFLKENLDKEIEQRDGELKQLCLLLGNLPMAMQLAVAALNVQKIDVRSYIEKTSTQQFENVNNTFDEYEKTINASVDITLELIAKEEGGSFAKQVLNVFGYIRPDNVEKQFLTTVFNFEDSELTHLEMTKALELLTNYSLITQGNIIQAASENSDEQLITCFSIHRLLQQVIRHNGRKAEEDTLRKILCCKGFLNYKLLPFTKYAGRELRKEFPKIKAELLDQQQLLKLLKENRFEESVELSKFIHKEIERKTTAFNYALCLERNGQLDDSITVLEELYSQDIEEGGYYDYESVEMGLLNLESEVSKCLVGGHLLISLWKMNNKERMQEILHERKSIKVIPSQERLTTLLLTIFNSKINCNCSLTYNRYAPMFELVLDRDTKKSFENGKDTSMIVGEWLPKKLNTLDINCRYPTPMLLSLKCISFFENVTLSDCSLSLDSVNRISPRVLKLTNVSFYKNGKELSNVKVNEFIGFHKMNRLELIRYEKKNVSIDLSKESANMEYLHLDGVTVLSLKSAHGGVNIKEARIDNCLLDLSIFPPSLEKLTLYETEVNVGVGIELPNLKYLILRSTSLSSHFRSLQLTHLYLRFVFVVNVNLLPPIAKIIRIDNTWPWKVKFNNKNIDKSRTGSSVGGVIHLDTLILKGFTLTEVGKVLPHFHLQQLVLYNSYNPVDLTLLMEQQIPTIAIGWVKWEDDVFENSLLSKRVDRHSEYYLLHEGRGKAIEEHDFYELYLLSHIFGL